MTNGFASRATTRESSRSRDPAQQAIAPPEAAQDKLGSGLLADSSVTDGWNYKAPWGSKRSLPSGRSISQARYPETSTAQQRSASNAGLNSLSTTQNLPSFGSRPPTINLNATTAQTRPSFSSTFSSGASGRGSEQPPNVYTKFDRPGDPSARRPPDSAKDVSPTDNRKPVFSNSFSGRTVSTPTSRDGSIPSSGHGNEQHFFNQPDFSRGSHRPSQNGSRATSMSSQGNGPHSQFTNPSSDHLTIQLSNMSINGENRTPTSYRAGPGANSPFGQPPGSSGSSQASRSAFNGLAADLDLSHETSEFGHAGMNGLNLNGYTSPHHAQNFSDYEVASYGGRLMQTPTASDFRHSQPYANGNLTNRNFDIPTGPRLTSDWPSLADSPVSPNRDSPSLQEQQLYLDPRVQAMLASQLRNPYSPVYNPYAVPNPLQLSVASPYIPVLPVNVPALDSQTSAGEQVVVDGVQSALMYEFKSNTKSKRYELKDIYDHIAEFSGDQHGSRFIQTKLESANSDEKDRVFREIQPNAIQLMTDVFGNYVIQKFFEHGDQTHKKILANKMRGQVLNLSLQMYGCRVVQKALDHVLVDQQALLISELETHVLKCVKDQNGNHVIQKAIERCPADTIAFIISAFQGQVQHLSIHPYGCRVIQRCLERCEPQSKAMIMAELMDGIQSMISDQYGNYVVQHVVEHDEGGGRRHVLNIVGRGLEAYSKHKFASNVVEKCLERAPEEWKRQVVYALAQGNTRRGEGEGVLVGMIKDNFGNYVIRESCLDLH